MKTRLFILSVLAFLWNAGFAFSQEWNSLKSYQKETGNLALKEGCWLRKDRKKQDEVWQKANRFNLSSENGNLKYQTICQIRDFYQWFDQEREKQGHEIKWIGIAKIVTGQLSKLDCSLIRTFIVRNKEVVDFGQEGSKKVFEFGFPQLKEVYFSNEIIKGKAAESWDLEYGMKEQCTILEPLYKKLSPKALWKLNRMAKRKGIYILGVHKELEYVGSIEDCQTRFEYGINKIHPFNLATKENQNCISPER